MIITDDTAMPEAVKEDIDRAVQILRAGRCTEIYLFGSGVTGRVSNDSDIDLAVRGCPPHRYFHLLGQLLMQLDRSVDLVNLDTHGAFAQYLLKKGELRRVG